MAARLTRAKKRIVASGTGVELPDDLAVEERMPAVRRTIHLAYAMGHTAGSGGDLRDEQVAAHAVRLARALRELRPDDSEAAGLLALVVLTEARAGARFALDGSQVLLADGDRAGWDQPMLTAGLELVASLRGVLGDRPDLAGRPGPLALQAAIAAEHAAATTFERTDWGRIVGWYDMLLTIEPSPTIALGRCVALSYLVSPEAGLVDLDEVIALGHLDRYPYAHAARAQMLARLGRGDEAAASWAAAAGCARTDTERTFFAAESSRSPGRASASYLPPAQIGDGVWGRSPQ